jgi:2-polyprenyl-3-methyl-5-hydroxy-6-metoxy-1,4-benzoquinol methylase
LNSEDKARAPILNLLRKISINSLKPLKVLEMGCGNGRNLAIFKEQEHDVFGIDGLEDAVNECILRGIPAQLNNLCNEINIKNKWDLILIIDVLEHLENPQDLLSKARSLLSENGTLIINVPNHFSLQGRLRILLGSGIDSEKYFPDSQEWNYPHQRFFTHDGIKRLLDISGYELKKDHSTELLRLPNQRFLPERLIAWFWRRLPINLSTGGFFLELTKR